MEVRHWDKKMMAWGGKSLTSFGSKWFACNAQKHSEKKKKTRNKKMGGGDGLYMSGDILSDV